MTNSETIVLRFKLGKEKKSNEKSDMLLFEYHFGP